MKTLPVDLTYKPQTTEISWDFSFKTSAENCVLGVDSLAKTIVVVDGMNVAIRFGDKKFKAEGLKITTDYWESLGHSVLIMLPDFCFS